MTTEFTLTRKTHETDISVTLDLYHPGANHIDSGLKFLDHMLNNFSKHAQIGLKLSCDGDLEIDDHHTIEDCAIVLGKTMAKALGDKAGIARFGYAYAPLDEALSRAVIDCSGRAHAEIHLDLRRDTLGDVACENFYHFFQTLASNANLTLHIDVLRGFNDHHKIESAFKAFALAFRQAITRTGNGAIASTKGVLAS